MAFDNNKLGELRPNQIITTFGPGSVVDAVKDSVTILDISYWKQKGQKIIDGRLASYLGVDCFYMPRTSFSGDIPVVTFPYWHVCSMLKRSCSELSDAHCEDIVASILGAMTMSDSDKVSLVVTAPPSFAIKARTTMNVVQSMINGADRNILITGYSLSSYFSELVDTIIQKSQRGVFVKFFVNDIDKQPSFDKILRYKGRFLKIYNYRQDDDKMAALHAKVISVDQQQTLITSANLSYHGQQGNIELGTLIESKQIAKQIDDIFTKLIFTKDFCEI